MVSANTSSSGGNVAAADSFYSGLGPGSGVSVVGAGVTVTRHPMPGVAPGDWSLVTSKQGITHNAYYAFIM